MEVSFDASENGEKRQRPFRPLIPHRSKHSWSCCHNALSVLVKKKKCRRDSEPRFRQKGLIFHPFHPSAGDENML